MVVVVVAMAIVVTMCDASHHGRHLSGRECCPGRRLRVREATPRPQPQMWAMGSALPPEH